MSTTIEDRVILLLKDRAGSQDADARERGVAGKILDFFERKEPAGGHGFWERLADYTGIASKRWRKVYGREQRVTSDMLEVLARLFPQHAFWLTTGITDSVNGHVAPMTAQTFPERLYQESSESNRYFQASIDLLEKLYKEGNVNMESDKERLYAMERTQPLAHWHGSPLIDAAYRISSSDEYASLKAIWQSREQGRQTRVKYITQVEDRPWVQKRSENSSKGVKITPFLGIDARTQHQDDWDIFFEPAVPEPRKFALTLLNTPPQLLTDADLEGIAKMDLFVVEEYLRHHEIDPRQVIQSKPGTLRHTSQGLTVDELDALKQLARRGAKAN